MNRVAQGVKQYARRLKLIVVLDPQLGKRLVRRYLTGDTAGVLALHGGRNPGVAEQVGPQGCKRQIGRGDEALHEIRLGGEHSRGSAGTIAHLKKLQRRI